MNRIREWKKFLVPYEQAVEELKVKFKSIRNDYRDLNEYSPIEFVTGRVKKISSIMEKCERRNIPEERIAEEMEDIAGIRIMCQFIDDIYRVVDLIKKRDGKDLMIVYEKDYISNPKSSGYKSYHIIIKYPVQTAFGEKLVLAEIQIRTLAMNFWATIEHSLNYKYGKDIPDKIQVRLKAAADAANNLDHEMYEIRTEVIKAQLKFEERSSVVSDISSNLQIMNKMGRKDEAFMYQEKFDKIFGTGNLDALDDLLEEIENNMPRYKMFVKNVTK